MLPKKSKHKEESLNLLTKASSSYRSNTAATKKAQTFVSIPQKESDFRSYPPLNIKRLVIPIVFGTDHVHVGVETSFRHHGGKRNLLEWIWIEMRIEAASVSDDGR